MIENAEASDDREWTEDLSTLAGDEEIDAEEIGEVEDEQPEAPATPATLDASEAMTMAKRAYEQSQTFLEASQMRRWRKNFALAQSEHPDGSRYLTEAYANRARHFRGKTEASLRKNEAAMAVAMFSNRDVVSITPKNDGIPGAAETVAAVHELVNHHLDVDIKWFLLSLGAYHEAMIAGDVVSENYWHYERDDAGNVMADKPAINLIPLENIKISPQAGWLDPIHTSPFVIVEEPMYVGDIKARMEVDWKPYEESEIQAAAVKYRLNDLKKARQGRDQATAEDAAASAVTDFDYVFVHKNFIRHKNQEWFFYSLGTEKPLSDPVPVSEQYPHLPPGRRPFVWGTVTIEPHKVYRRSLVDRVANAQNLANEIGNLRVDNVRQALNKRKYVQRYAGVDYAALKASVPGGIVMMDDIGAVKPEDMIDVTGSSYQEQAVVNSDFDEMSGTFSASSVATNRELNETVGGMQLLEGTANALTEYQLRIFVETWVEPVVRDVVEMVKFYEDDDKIMEVTGKPLTNEQLQVPVAVRADVGFGSTDPNGKVQKLILGVNSVNALPGMAQRMDAMAVSREVFSILGFSDGKKFIPDEQVEDPRIAQLVAELQKMQQIIATDQHKIMAQAELEKVKGKNSLTETVIKTTAERQVKLTQMALDRGMKLKDLEARTGVDSGKLNLEYLKEMNRRMDIETQKDELQFKMTTGKDGI